MSDSTTNTDSNTNTNTNTGSTTNTDEKPIVIIGIGHSSLFENAQSQDLRKNPELLELAKNDPSYNPQIYRVTEYRFCKELASLIVKELDALGIKGLTANRYEGADLNGHSKGEKDMGAEIDAIIREFAKHKKGTIKAVVDLHLNSADNTKASYYLSYSTNNKEGQILDKILKKNIYDVLQNKPNKSVFFGKTKVDVAGSAFPRRLYSFAPATLLELFFVSNNKSLQRALEKKVDLAKAIAKSFKQYIDNDFPPFDYEEALKEAYTQSSSLVEDKLKSRYNNDQIKTSYLNAQNKLHDIEKQMGEGGDRYTTSLRNSIEIVGSKPLPYQPSLVDQKGNVFTQPILRSGGVALKQQTYPLFQAIDYSSDVPTGKKYIFVNSLYELKSYEVNQYSNAHTRMQAGGCMSLGAGEQLDISSAISINLTSANVINIEGKNIQINGTTTMTGALGVVGTSLVTAQSYAQGGMYSPSFNGPAVIDKTNSQELYGYISAVGTKLKLGPSILRLTKPVQVGDTEINIKSAELVINEVDSGLGEGRGGRALVTIPGHKHYFKRLNGELADSIVAIQDSIAPAMNSTID